MGSSLLLRSTVGCYSRLGLCLNMLIAAEANNSSSEPGCLIFLQLTSQRSIHSGRTIKRIASEVKMSASTSPSPSAKEVAAEDAAQQIKLLKYKEDAYGGAIVEIDEPVDSTSFVLRLSASMSRWKQQGKKGVWIELPIDLVNLAEPLVKEGFWPHHAESKYIMFVYWIPESTNTIPANASHQIGVGAFVVNDKREVLVVQEKSGLFRGKGAWKFPTGVVNQGEDICAAVAREVKEETGVDSEFVEVLAFRQSHNAFFGKSDLFFLCMLHPISSDIRIDETEIEAAQWMPFEEYSAQPFVQESKLLKNMSDVCRAKIEGLYAGFAHVPTNSRPGQPERYLYLNAGGLKRLSCANAVQTMIPLWTKRVSVVRFERST